MVIAGGTATDALLINEINNMIPTIVAAIQRQVNINHHKIKTRIMYYNQSWTPFAAGYGRHRHGFWQSHQRAAVNVYKTATSYELLVFAPGRIKENFNVKARGNELTISYEPPEGLPTPNWISREYSRGAFERSFNIDETVDATNIKATYIDGVLQVSLPIIPGTETPERNIEIN